MAKQRKLVVTTFYSNGQAIWIAERPVKMTDDELLKYVKDVNKKKYGTVDACTDTTGRMFFFDENGDFKK